MILTKQKRISCFYLRQPKTYTRQPSTDHEDSEDEYREPGEWDYPEQALQRHMEILDEKRSANLERINKTYEFQKQNLKRMADAIEYQAYEDFAVGYIRQCRSFDVHHI
jgi:hypothetical protein